ncbi:MAG TPA: LL-diaminopimelate aminotransferase [bacterium]|nr:LL-diaminopimelate aminotransferase [bacterium]HPQ66628.1 LL-diaminopimelate aminotransferase [bacterium]
MNAEASRRLKRLPPYLFAEIDRVKRRLRGQGRDLIDLGVGDPDTPTPSHIVDALCRASRDPENHRYALDAGMPALREAIAAWYRRRFEVELDPVSEVLPLIGSKEGIGHLPLAFVDPGDAVLIPEPGYPVYQAGTIFAGGEPVFMPLRRENGFLPDFSAVEAAAADRARILWINYPNNPTAAVCDLSFFAEAVEFAARRGIIVAHDAAYTELAFDGFRPPSFLQVPGARETGIEFHSLSKTYSMTGWRISFAVGNAEVLAGLARVKSNLDSGIFQAVQVAGIAALTGPQDYLAELLAVYRDRRDLLVDGLRNLGWEVDLPRATFYVWCPVPPGRTSSGFTQLLLEEAGIVTTPGVGLGPSGEGYIRMALTRPREEIAEALRRLEKLELKWA